MAIEHTCAVKDHIDGSSRTRAEFQSEPKTQYPKGDDAFHFDWSCGKPTRFACLRYVYSCYLSTMRRRCVRRKQRAYAQKKQEDERGA